MNIKSFIAFITVLFFLFSAFYPKVARGNPWVIKQIAKVEEPNNDEKITPMKTGDRAPYPGILFSISAASKIQVERETANEKCQIKVDKEVGLKQAEATLLLQNEKAAKESAQERLTEIRKLKDDQIMFMTKQIEKQQKKERRVENLTGLWIAVGVIGGLLVGVSSAYIYSKVK